MTVSGNPMFGNSNLNTMYKRVSLLSVLIVLSVANVYAESRGDTVVYTLNAQLNAGGGDYAPFLSTYNQYDRFSTSPNSTALWGTLHKEMHAGSTFDYGYGVELDANISPEEHRIHPGELYVQGRISFMMLTVGMRRFKNGLEDPELSSGGLIFSQNARPLPAIMAETNGFVDVPFTKGYLSFQAGLLHGWFDDHTVTKQTLLHYKFLNLRIGGAFPLNFKYSIQHACQWGGVSPYYGAETVNWANYLKIFKAEAGGSDSPATEQYNALGNHLFSLSMGLDLKLDACKVSAYWQNLYEDGPVFRMTKAYNMKDGLWGLSLRMPHFKPLEGLVVEYLCSTDQSGPWHDLDGVIYGGSDNYYNNGVYTNGWTHYSMTIGNPFLTSPVYNTDGSVSVENNMVKLCYVSAKGSFGVYNYRATLAYSKNYGSNLMLYTSCRKQYSWLFHVDRPLPFWKNVSASLGMAGDLGAMYGHNFQVMAGISYSGLFNY
jgi:hypothetical protein